MTLRGSPCLYQGDELGLPEAEVAYEDLQDPYGITMWPEFKGRDGCRTPMPWDSTAVDLGFGNYSPKAWLPITGAYRKLSVNLQQRDPDSMLHFYRQLLHWRRSQPVLIKGEQSLLPVHPQVLAYVREHAGERVLCALNFSDRPATLTLPTGLQAAAVLDLPGLQGGRLQGGELAFEAFGGLLLRLA
jgi:alpha-glucosidase